MASGTLERCSLHGWIPVFTVQGRWQTVCSVVNVVDRVAHGGSGVMVWAGVCYGQQTQVRCILLMAFWIHRDTVTRFWDPLLCHLSTTITSCCSMIMHGPMLQRSVHNSWKLKTSQFLHGQHTHLTRHVTHWACLGCSGSAYTTACSSSCQYPATSHSHWRGADQHFTINNLINSMRRRCVALHQILTGFRTPSDSHKTVKQHFKF